MRIKDKIKEKLADNYTSLTLPEKIAYFFTTRPFMTTEDKKFFEGSLILRGQLLKAERETLYDIVRQARPDFCFEIGTYTGGGSTYFIAKALNDNQHGRLITSEIDAELFRKTKKRYKIFHRQLNYRIAFINNGSPEGFKKYIFPGNKNLFFLDGAENGRQTLEQFLFFKKHIKSKDIIAFHDWNSEKTIEVKPLIINNKDYTLVKELKSPESVGLAIFVKN